MRLSPALWSRWKRLSMMTSPPETTAEAGGVRIVSRRSSRPDLWCSELCCSTFWRASYHCRCHSRESGRGQFWINGTGHIRYWGRKTIILSCHICLINSGVEKNEHHLNMDYNLYHQMSLSKSKCYYTNNCLHFLKRAVPFKKSFKFHQLFHFHLIFQWRGFITKFCRNDKKYQGKSRAPTLRPLPWGP